MEEGFNLELEPKGAIKSGACRDCGKKLNAAKRSLNDLLYHIDMHKRYASSGRKVEMITSLVAGGMPSE